MHERRRGRRLDDHGRGPSHDLVAEHRETRSAPGSAGGRSRGRRGARAGSLSPIECPRKGTPRRLMVRFRFPVEPGNEIIRSGKVGKGFEELLTERKPEAG